jgi:UDP-N-acetyl-D-mannosaminuronic acid dehydrogenase
MQLRAGNLPASFGDGRICIVGLGYVGLTLAVAMADSGFEVYGSEVRQDVLDSLLRREPHFFEPRLREKLARVLGNGKLRVGSNIDRGFNASVYIITVGTPLRTDGSVELDFIERAARQVSAALKDGDLVILRSTVKLGTARGIVSRVLAETHKSFEIAVCPERTLEGRALLELHELPQVIGADGPETRYRCSQLFSLMTPTIVTVSSLEAAELVKLVDNTYRDVTFAFANEVAHLCGRAGLSASEVISAGKLGYRRTNTAAPGPVGGPCLEKDPHILSQSASELGVEMLVTNAARKTNETQPALIADLLWRLTSELSAFPQTPRIAVMGLAFKGLPPTDDLRGTMAKPIVEELAKKYPAARFVGYDPVVAADKSRAHLGIEIVPTAEAAFRDSDIVVIANNHSAFSTMDLATYAESMRRPGIVYDLWNMFDDVARSMPADLHYVGLGSENAAPVSGSTRRAPVRRRSYAVTGGTGFIGASLVRRLLDEGHEVRVIDNDLRGSAHRLDDAKGRFELINCDVRNGEAVSKATRGADSILHLAALNGTENFYKRPELVLDVGVRGMLAVMEAAKANSIRELVVASSSEAYQTPATVPTAEDVPLLIPDPWNPRYSYGGSKAISEVIAANYNRDLFERVMIFRPHNVYGPDMGLEHVLPQLVLRAFGNIKRVPAGPVPIEIQGDGTQTRSFVHISDFIDGLMLLLERGKTREVYHIGTEEEVTIREIVGHVFRYFGREHTLVPTPLPAGGTLRRCPSIRKLEALGFKPRVRLQDGIAELAGWYVARYGEQNETQAFTGSLIANPAAGGSLQHHAGNGSSFS